MIQSVCFGSSACFLAVCAQAQAGSRSKPATIEDCQYADDAAAQAAWEPMRGTTPVALATVEGRRALRLPCNFAGTKLERASWDRRWTLDLASCQAIQFKLFCREASPVSYFSLYFQSGEGWYHATFFPESSPAWNTITIDKAATGTEGKPAGWGQIKAIRLSAWRGKDANTEFYLSDLRQIGVLGADATVAILRAESAQRGPDEARSVEQFSEGVTTNLRALDVPCAVVSDLEVTAERLKQAKLVVLPHNPSMPDRVVEELLRYVRGGGKLLAFYTVPERLCAVLQVQDGRHVKVPRPGYFSAMRFGDRTLPGAPTLVNQQSWNINALKPIPGASGSVMGRVWSTSAT